MIENTDNADSNARRHASIITILVRSHPSDKARYPTANRRMYSYSLVGIMVFRNKTLLMQSLDSIS